MADGASPVEFELVESDDEDPIPEFEPVSADEQARAAAEPTTRQAPTREAASDAFESRDFPLAGPIVDGARDQQLRGHCSSCDSKLRLRVKGGGFVRVKCPICGNTKRIRV